MKNSLKKLKFLILNAKEKYREVTDKRLFGEMIKMEIRIFSIRFAKRKVKEKEIWNSNFSENSKI